MATFELKFERYVQEAARVEIEAASLSDAMAKAAELDTAELHWYDECQVDGDRLFGVFDEEGEELAVVELDHLFCVPTWFSADLRCQWKPGEQSAGEGEAA